MSRILGVTRVSDWVVLMVATIAFIVLYFGILYAYERWRRTGSRREHHDR